MFLKDEETTSLLQCNRGKFYPKQTQERSAADPSVIPKVKSTTCCPDCGKAGLSVNLSLQQPQTEGAFSSNWGSLLSLRSSLQDLWAVCMPLCLCWPKKRHTNSVTCWIVRLIKERKITLASILHLLGFHWEVVSGATVSSICGMFMDQRSGDGILKEVLLLSKSQRTQLRAL